MLSDHDEHDAAKKEEEKAELKIEITDAKCPDKA